MATFEARNASKSNEMLSAYRTVNMLVLYNNERPTQSQQFHPTLEE
jgi:hypothetical protein